MYIQRSYLLRPILVLKLNTNIYIGQCHVPQQQMLCGGSLCAYVTYSVDARLASVCDRRTLCTWQKEGIGGDEGPDHVFVCWETLRFRENCEVFFLFIILSLFVAVDEKKAKVPYVPVKGKRL